LNEILDTAKLDKGAVELEVADFNLLGLIDELSSTLGANARAKGLHVDIHYDPDLPTCLRGDELRIRQVLTNLLDNAIKFTAAGSVTLVAEAQEDELHFLVQDTGIGIAPERLAAIFDPFTQADASMTRRYGGTGLGTTISKQLVDLMGGRIWAESTPGEGTRFHVLLPLVAAQFAPQQPRPRTALVLPPLRILVADDVPQNLELLTLLLTRRGHTVTSVADGEAAAGLAARDEFDLILMDMQMPKLDGLEATRAIRAAAERAGRRRVPIVAMTASVLDAHRRASTEAGMDGFASKPVEWFALSHEMGRVLGLDAGSSAAPAPQAGQQVLNRRAGLRRWTGREDAYRQALDHFETQFGNVAATLAEHAAANDRQGAKMLAHKARGVAANVGLEQLTDTLAQLEHLCAEEDGTPAAGIEDALRGLLARAADDLSAALAAIRPTAMAPAAVAAVAAVAELPAAVDPERVQRSGAALLQSLRRGALDDGALAELSAALAGHARPELMAQVHVAIADFDFDLAQRRVAALLEAELAP
jgi:CheY-like chemotaxis protein